MNSGPNNAHPALSGDPHDGLALAVLPAALRERWRDESVGSVWLRPSDWYHPAVDAIAAAILSPIDTAVAAEELGRARGYDGVGIGETIDDLGALYRALGASEPPAHVIRALCEGWADAQAGALAFGTALDPESGLPTRQYLAIRLAETYRDAAIPTQRDRTTGDVGHHLVLVDVAAGDIDPFTRAARSAAVGAAMTTTYGEGHPMATLGGGVFAVLARTDQHTPTPLEALQAEIDRRCGLLDLRALTRMPVRVWVEPLPDTHEQALRTLERVARS
ncbi:hypothetical protein [Cellulomonas sp. URHE0023]|uniref:hypothetical protein n=1 Tax=Cellulomonas sp. URHE0023 TaxID=1380354 RepID=UPI001E41EB2E|nr:hypothetical protein [Cellulomonas sp. URHE0023]